MPIGAILNAVTGGGGNGNGGGILSAVIGGATGALSNIPIVGPIAATVAQGALAPALAVGGQALGAIGLGGILGNGAAPVAGAPAGPVVTTGFSGGNGRFGTRTTVETMDFSTGLIVRTRSMPGQPFMMKKDVTTMRRVIKQTNALQKRIPRKTVTPSKTKQLTEAAIDRALMDTRRANVQVVKTD